MSRRKAPEDLSVEELRRLLVEKRRGTRKDRLEHFRRTGRVVTLESEVPDFVFDEAPVVDTADATGAAAEPKRRRLADNLLLFVEVLAVVGLVGILLSGLGLLRDLNREVAAALNPVTPTPTPLVMAVVLPSGHTPPDAQGNTRPNEAEIPEHLRPMVQSLANIPEPPPQAGQAIRIQIPALDVDAPVVQGDGWEQLKKGVAQHLGTGDPGQDGNVVLSAHNDVYGELFRFLDKLQPGDQVILYTQQRQYTYIVDRTVIVKPTQVEVMAPTADRLVTLISCYPYFVYTDGLVLFEKISN
jgi:sortase A